MTAETERLTAAFAVVNRADFLTVEQRSNATQDRPLFIGHGQTNSQPTTVRNMLALLDPRPGHRVLDVGSGSGWTTALLAKLVTPTGRVFGVELVPDLTEWGRANLSGYHVEWATIDQADPERLGLAQHAPYDRILVSAEARELPDSLVEQVAPGGRMVIPVAGRLSVVDRAQDGQVQVRRVGHYAFVPLRESQAR
jgi:protein-L-isoaspartate(D-aspartate) O-methyltransferase